MSKSSDEVGGVEALSRITSGVLRRRMITKKRVRPKHKVVAESLMRPGQKLERAAGQESLQVFDTRHEGRSEAQIRRYENALAMQRAANSPSRHG